MHLSLSFINGHHQFFSANHISERIMAHFSAFFTAILLLICALLIEQLAVAQTYGQLLGSDESDYDYGSPNGNAGLNQDPDNAESDGMSMDEEAPVPDGVGDIENRGEDDGDEDVGASDSGNDDEGDEEESGQNQGMLDPEDEDTSQHQTPSYSKYLYGGLRNRALGQGYSTDGLYGDGSKRRSRGRGSFNHLSSPYVDPDTMPTVPEETSDYDDSEGNNGDPNGSTESPGDNGEMMEAPEEEIPEEIPENDKKKTDTLVTVQEGNAKKGDFRWRIVQSMNKSK